MPLPNIPSNGSSNYPVSTLTLEIPTRTKTFFPEKYKLESKPALCLETSLVTIYYPCKSGLSVNPSKSASGSDQDSPSEGHQATAQQQSQTSQSTWLEAPRLTSVSGLLKYAGIPKYLALPAILPAWSVFTQKLPYPSDQPLSEPRSSGRIGSGEGKASDRFPVAVFSHGLGGTKTAYSSYCSYLASSGVVVAAVEHRDGTSSCTSVFKSERGNDGAGDDGRMEREEGEGQEEEGGGGSTAGKADEGQDDEDQGAFKRGFLDWLSNNFNLSSKVELKAKLYTKPEELQVVGAEGDNAKIDAFEFRRAQIEQRKEEVLLAFETLSRIDSGEGAELIKSCARSRREAADVVANRSKVVSDWKGRLGIEDCWLVGHSFGGSTALELMKHQDQPFTNSLLLDPWLEPLLISETDKFHRPVYIINSEGFSTWKTHVEDVRRVSRMVKQQTGRGWFITLGADHSKVEVEQGVIQEREKVERGGGVGALQESEGRGPHPSRLILVHDMFGTMFSLSSPKEALRSLFPEKLRREEKSLLGGGNVAEGTDERFLEMVIMDWFHATQRDFTYLSVNSDYRPIGEVFRFTLPRILRQSGILPTAAEAEAANQGTFENVFEDFIIDTIMSSLPNLEPRPGMVEAFKEIYRDVQGKGNLPACYEKVDVWAATNGGRPLARSLLRKNLGEIDGDDLVSGNQKADPSRGGSSKGRGVGVFSCDDIKVAKPDPRVYQAILESVKAGKDGNGFSRSIRSTSKEDVEGGRRGLWFIASHSWDTFAAKKAGFRTAWVGYEEFYDCREIYGRPDVVGRDLKEVAEKILEFEKRDFDRVEEALKGGGGGGGKDGVVGGEVGVVEGSKQAAAGDGPKPYFYSTSKDVRKPPGTVHTSFSDFPFILPSKNRFGGSLPASDVLRVLTELSRRCIEGSNASEEGGVDLLRSLGGEGRDGHGDWQLWVEGRSPPPLVVGGEEEEEGGSKVKGRIVLHL
ncbi:hypothetical protein IE53DRAFT_389819 [Violaceomyces palustris]|uniref:Uncharacterized protein n=1 Tax=Violaceomyces palustris TaxID=1673888 RepID=A0ACD0NQG1_9BASI|nr:hypothetical protein IE53DRAFT_389819 [Violaceomyces palustris]